jgi:hypothetical protein
MAVLSNYTLEMLLNYDVVQNESMHDSRKETGLGYFALVSMFIQKCWQSFQLCV